MKPKSLYVKILLSFLGVLVVTEILILALFVVTAGRSFRNQIDKQSIAKLIIFKESVQEKIRRHPQIPLEQNSELKKYLMTFSELFDLKIWLTTAEGTPLFKTFSSPVNISISTNPKHIVTRDGIQLHHLSRRHFSYYAKIRIEKETQDYTLHLYLKKEREKKPEAVFLIGLLTIGCIIALLIVPLTRLITQRVKQLNESALQFANGSLACRTNIKGQDEIAELGESFNFMADKLEKMIHGNKSLMANISHEFRSPLARIRVSKELIQERLLGVEHIKIDRYMDHIDQDIDALDNLIDQILKLSKMDFQDVSQTKEKIHLKQFFDQIEQRFSLFLQQKNITVKKEFENDLTLSADKQILDTIFSNLLDNAVKYTKNGGEIISKASTSDALGVLFSISNPYRRLSSLELEQLFKPFYRADKGNLSGAGIGLTIVEKLLKKSNAKIKVKNSEEGLVFELEFKIE